MFEGLKGGDHTKTFFLQYIFLNFFSTFIKMHFIQIKNFFHKNMQVIKKKELLTARSSNCSVSAKFFSMLMKRPYFGGVIYKKNLLKPWIRLKVFFLSSLSYESVKLLVFKKKSYKISKNWIFFFNYWYGTQPYLWIWSLF